MRDNVGLNEYLVAHLDAARQAVGFSWWQIERAGRCNICNYRHHGSLPSPLKLVKLCYVLGVNSDWLVGLTTASKPVIIYQDIVSAVAQCKGQFGARLQTCRKQAGLSRNKICQQLNIKLGKMKKYETGAMIPQLPMTLALAIVLDVKLSDLIGI